LIIEACRYEIGEGIAQKARLDESPVSHNFWVLRTDDGRIVSERHTLATGRKSGKPLVIGLVGSVNRFYTFTPDRQLALQLGVVGEMNQGVTYMQGNQKRHIVCKGPDTETLERWNTWGRLIPFLNSLDIPYPLFGLGVFRKTVNSNSGYATGAYLMGLEPYYFESTWNPGKKQLLLPKPVLDDLLARTRDASIVEYA